MAEETEVPTGRLLRLGRLAQVGARSGLSMLGRGDGSAAANRAVELLGNLRGLAAKVGQMASYVDGVVPDAQREAYEKALSALRNATAHSPFEKVRAVIETELGQPMAMLFAEFEQQPMASASIGQVHRARLHDGQEVVVKVQHPGIEAAIEADLKSTGTMAGMLAAVGMKAMDLQGVHGELAARFREELDYRLEAQRQTRFATFYASEPGIHVPQIVASHSAQRVMTSALVRGLDFDQALREPEATRVKYAQQLWRFVFKAMMVDGVFNADPHPGNYIFHEDGSVSFLDFGCVQELEPQYRDAARGMHHCAVNNDEAGFKRFAAIACNTRPGPYETELLAYLWRCFEPLKHSSWHMTREYVASVVRSTQDMRKHMFSRRSNVTPPPKGVMLLNRLQFGFFSVLARLDVTVNYAAIDRGLMALP